MRLVNYFITKSEYEIEDRRIDIIAFKYLQATNYNLLIELKYLKSSEATPEKIKQKIDQAKAQITEYSELTEVKNLKNLKKFIILFVGHRLEKLIE